MRSLKAALVLLLALGGCAAPAPAGEYAAGVLRPAVLGSYGLPNRTFLRPDTGRWADLKDRGSDVAGIADRLRVVESARRCDVFRLEEGVRDYFFYDESDRLLASCRIEE